MNLLQASTTLLCLLILEVSILTAQRLVKKNCPSFMWLIVAYFSLMFFQLIIGGYYYLFRPDLNGPYRNIRLYIYSNRIFYVIENFATEHSEYIG